MDELCSRQSELELDHDPDPSTTLFVTFPLKLHGIILHNRYLRGNDIIVVCILLKNHTGIIIDYSFANFNVCEVSNWIQNKSKDKHFVNAIPKHDHLQSISQHSSTLIEFHTI